MAQMEEALHSILGNQQAMEQIMALANSLSSEQGSERESKLFVEQEEASVPEVPSKPPVFIPEEDRDLALLTAVKPFLRSERQEKLEQALELVRMLRMFRTAFRGEGGCESE